MSEKLKFNMEGKDMANVPDSVLLHLQKDVAEIKSALLGNEYSSHRGLIYRQACTEKNLDAVTNKVNKILWTAAGISAAVSVIFGAVMIIVNIAKSGI